MRLLMAIVLFAAPSLCHALPADLELIRDIAPKTAAPVPSPSSGLDQKPVYMLLDRHPELSMGGGSHVLKSPFDFGNTRLRGWAKKQKYKMFQIAAPDEKLIRVSKGMAPYSMTRLVIGYLGSPVGVMFAGLVLIAAVWFGLQERYVGAFSFGLLYIVWSSMPLLKLFTAWWA